MALFRIKKHFFPFWLFCAVFFSGGCYARTAGPQKGKTDKILWVIPTENRSKIEQATLASLQGLLNRGKDKFFLEIPSNRFWEEEYRQIGYQVRRTDFESLLKTHRDEVKGYVLCDDDNIPVAATVAGVLDAVVVAEPVRKKFALGDLPLLFDVRGKDEMWLLEYVKQNIGKYDLDGILQPASKSPSAEIDYAIQQKKICFCGDGNEALVRGFYSLIEPNTPRVGWGSPYGKELQDVSLGAEYGLYTLPSGLTHNMSLLSRKDISLPRVSARRNSIRNLPRKDVHYVMIMISDGDNVNWHLNGGVAQEKYMGNPLCGKYPLNWMYPPLMADKFPMGEYYYKKLLPGSNYLLGGVSGAGYTYPSKHKNLEDYALLTSRAMEQTGLDYCVIMDVLDLETAQKEVLKKMLDKMPRVKGLYYMDYGNYAKWKGDMYFIGDKPVVSFRYRLWLPKDPLEKIAGQINAAPRDPSSPAGYSAVVVHAWSYVMEDVERFIGLLDEDVVLVTADQMMELIRNNIKK